MEEGWDMREDWCWLTGAEAHRALNASFATRQVHHRTPQLHLNRTSAFKMPPKSMPASLAALYAQSAQPNATSRS